MNSMRRKPTLLITAGTRPEAVKVAPVVRRLREDARRASELNPEHAGAAKLLKRVKTTLSEDRKLGP